MKIKIAIFCAKKHVDLFKLALYNVKSVDFFYVYEEDALDQIANEYQFSTNENLLRELLIRNIDFAIVYGWNHLIPEKILAKFDFYNIHPSLLPKYRGPYPIPFQIINKEKCVGVTIHKMDKTYDTGSIYIQEEITVDYHKLDVLEMKIFRVAIRMINKLIDDYCHDSIDLVPQPTNGATYYSKEDLFKYLNDNKFDMETTWILKILDINKSK